jgi:hypothetical protein
MRFFQYLMENVKPTICIDSTKTSIHYSAIVNRGQILVATCNKVGYRCRKTREGPRYTGKNSYPACTIHAEIMAIRLLGDTSKLRGSELYVWRFNAKGDKPLNSKPCTECSCVLEKCMKEYGLKCVYYSV